MSRTMKTLRLVAVAMLGTACGSKGPGGPTPSISSLTPATGTVGTVVTIAGSSFAQSGTGTSAVNPTVTFKPAAGGSAFAATVLAFSPTSIDVQVPQVDPTVVASGTQFDVAVANPGGGSATLAKAFTMTAPALTDINGGTTGSGTVNSLFIVDGHNFGDLSAAPTGTYSVDFRDAVSSAVVATAAVNYANLDWQDIFIVGTVPGGLSASTTYKVTVTTPSGTSAPLSFLVTGAVSFSPSTISWTATSSLPVAEQGLASAIASIGSSSFLYALGGNTASAATTNGKNANVASVYFNQMVATSGALANAAWTAATPLPDKRGFAAGVAATSFNSVVSGNGVLYLIGGLDGAGAATSTVYFASLAPDGTVPAAGAPGTWATTTALPQPLFATSAVIFHGRIYLAGGNDSTGTPVAKVYSAKINPDGTLAAWQALSDLPAALAYHQLVTSGGSLYVLGGTTAAVDPLSSTQSASAQGSIYLDPINIRTGGLSSLTWTTNSAAMGKSREKFTAVAAGSYLLISGGLYNGAATGSSEEAYASINTDGTIASFNGATGSHTISGSTGGYNFFNHAATLFVDSSGNPHVIVLGGSDTTTGAPHAGVWYQH